MVGRAWRYIARHYRDDWQPDGGGLLLGVPHVPQLRRLVLPGRVVERRRLTADERKEILDFSFRHWKQHSPYLKGLLALTLKRMGRPDDAKLVFD